MTQIDTALQYLLQTIKESSEYQRYQKARAKLSEQPELERSVHEFRKKNYLIQNSGNINLFDEVDRLEQENTEMRREPIVEEYLTAELAFCRVVQNINWTLINELDFEVGFAIK